MCESTVLFSMLSERGYPLVVCDRFKYSKSTKTQRGQKWRCVFKSCSACIYTDETGSVLFETVRSHNHDPCATLARQFVSNSIKRKGTGCLLEPTSTVISREMSAPEGIACTLSQGDLDRVRRNLNEAKRNSVPQFPKSIDDMHDALNIINISTNQGQEYPGYPCSCGAPPRPELPERNAQLIQPLETNTRSTNNAKPTPPSKPTKPAMQPLTTTVSAQATASSVSKEQEDDDSSIVVQWNSYAQNMSTAIPNLLEDEQFVDVTLACDGKYIKCHKVILGACSAYFKELLSVNPCQHPIILMKDFQFWEIQAIVDFVYKGAVNIPQEKLPDLLQVANKLQIIGLMKTNEKSNEGVEDETDDNNTRHMPNSNAVPTAKPASAIDRSSSSSISVLEQSVKPTSTNGAKKVVPPNTRRKGRPASKKGNMNTSPIEEPPMKLTKMSSYSSLPEDTSQVSRSDLRTQQGKSVKRYSSYSLPIPASADTVPSPSPVVGDPSSPDPGLDPPPAYASIVIKEESLEYMSEQLTDDGEDTCDRSEGSSYNTGQFEVLTCPSIPNMKEEPDDRHHMYYEDRHDPLE